MRLIHLTPTLVSRVGERLKCIACGVGLQQEPTAFTTVGRNGKKNYICLKCGYKPVLVYQLRRRGKKR